MNNWVLFTLIAGGIIVCAALGIAFLTVLIKHVNEDNL